MTATHIADALCLKHGERIAREKVTARLDRAMLSPSPLRANWLIWSAIGAALVLRGER